MTLDQFDMAYKTNVSGLLHLAQLVCPKMQARKSGTFAITGWSCWRSSLRGKPFTAGFAPAKCAQRALAQSLAKTVGKDGVHVFVANIDGRVGVGEGKLHPDAIADAYWYVANQHSSAWTHEIDLRPNTRPNTEQW